MNKLFKSVLFSILFIFLFFLLPQEIFAVCPVCTVAVAGGLGLSRYLGVDDLITGIWLGGLLISISFWTLSWLQKKFGQKIIKINKSLSSPKVTFLIILFYYALTFFPLHATNLIGHPFNKFLGIDRLFFGSIVGSLVFFISIWTDKFVRIKRGKQLFDYQKVLFPLGFLTVISLITYLLFI